MVRDVFPAHLVHLQARPFRDCGGIGDAGRLHVAHKHRPFPVRHFPAELPVLHQDGQVLQGVIVHAVAEIDILRRFPQVGIPQGKRLLEHLGEGFFRIAGHVGHFGKGDGERAVGRVVQLQFIGSRRGFDQVLDPGSQGFEAHVQAHVVAVVGKCGDLLPVQEEAGRGPLFAITFQDQRTDGERHLHLQDCRDSFARFERPGLGIPLHRQPGLDRDDAVRCHIRKRQELLAPVPRHLLEVSLDILHALFRGDPRTAGLAPARAVEHPDFDAQFPGFLHRRMGDVPPRVGKERHGAVGVALGLVADESPRDAHTFHRLQVLHDALLGDMVVQPIPVHRRPDGVRRRPESLLQGLPTVVAGAQEDRSENPGPGDDNSPSHAHRFKWSLRPRTPGRRKPFRPRCGPARPRTTPPPRVGPCGHPTAQSGGTGLPAPLPGFRPERA